MKNGGSKGSKSEKRVEGETELSWDHEGLEPYPGPEKPKPQRSPKGSKSPKQEVNKRVSPKICPTCKRNHDEKDCIRIPSKKIERELPSLKDSKEENLGPKWNFQKGETVINNDTKQWVDEQNKYWKEEEKRKDREKQKECVPRKLQPKTCENITKG